MDLNLAGGFDRDRLARPGERLLLRRHAVQGSLRNHDLARLRQVVQIRDKVDIVAENILPVRGFDAQTIAEMQAEAKPQSAAAQRRQGVQQALYRMRKGQTISGVRERGEKTVADELDENTSVIFAQPTGMLVEIVQYSGKDEIALTGHEMRSAGNITKYDGQGLSEI